MKSSECEKGYRRWISPNKSTKTVQFKRRKLAKAIVDEIFHGMTPDRVLIGGRYKITIGIVEQLLKKHGI